MHPAQKLYSGRNAVYANAFEIHLSRSCAGGRPERAGGVSSCGRSLTGSSSQVWWQGGTGLVSRAAWGMHCAKSYFCQKKDGASEIFLPHFNSLNIKFSQRNLIYKGNRWSRNSLSRNPLITMICQHVISRPSCFLPFHPKHIQHQSPASLAKDLLQQHNPIQSL